MSNTGLYKGVVGPTGVPSQLNTDINGNLLTVSSGGGGGVTQTEDQADNLIGNAVTTTVLQVGYEDAGGHAQIPSATNPFPVTIISGGGSGTTDVTGWGTSTVSTPLASTPPAGTDVAPSVRTVFRKIQQLETNANLAAGLTFTGNWYDTQADGTNFAEVTILQPATASGSPVHIDCSDDQTNISTTAGLSTVATAGSVQTFSCPIPTRYWRFRFVNLGANAQNPLLVYSCGMNVSSLVQVQGAAGLPCAQNPQGYFVVTMANGNTFTEGSGSATSFMGSASNGTSQVLPSMNCVSAGTSAVAVTSPFIQRTPSTFRGGEGGSAVGAFPVWVPSISTKKPRLMKYSIEIGEDATITSGAPIHIGFAYGLPTSVAATILTPPQFDYHHRVFIPGTAPVASTTVVTNGLLWETDKDFGNGVIPTVAGQALYCGIQVPQSTSAITPTFTLPNSTQWEAGCFSFKTVGALGNFKLLQASPQATGVATVAVVPPSGGTQQGSTIILIVRSTNIVAGVPTVTVADTLGNSYSSLTAINNASDQGPTNGSSLQLFYCINAIGGANTITATGGTHAPTAMQSVYLEYANLSAIGTTGQVSGTGSSVTPALTTPQATFTPGEVGDLILFYAATATASQATLGSVSSPLFMRARCGGATGPTMFVADNFGNGSLTTGVVNVIAIGTEE